MEQIRKERISPLVWKPFLRILPIQIIELFVFAINTFVDSIVTSHYLGTDGVASIGFFNPVATFISVTDIIIFGTQILCGKHIGSGEKEKVVSLFSTGVAFLTIFSIATSAICLLLRNPLAASLGAQDHLVGMVASYILGYAPGIVFRVLVSMLMIFLPYNNDIKRCYFGIGVMIVSNTILDILFVTVFGLGIFGMGLATTCSYILTFAVMLPGFISDTKAVYMRFKDFCFNRLPEVARFGLPGLMMIVGVTIRGFVMNLTLMSSVGTAAVAAMTVQNTVCCITGSFCLGSANSFLTLGSIYYGEENRKCFVDLMRFALIFCALLSGIIVVLIMAASGPISSAFFDRADEAWEVTRRMLLLFPIFLIFNTISNVLMKAYQLQNKTGMVNFISVSEPLIMVPFAIAFIGKLGSDAVWLAFPFSEIVCMIILAGSVMIAAKKLTFALPDWMRLDMHFGATEEESMELSVDSIEQVLNLSEGVIEFCRERQVDERRSMLAGLSIEEMVGNVVEHGFRPGEKHHVDVRVVAKEKDRLIICVRDDCREFDPKSRLDQFDPEDPAKNVGIRMIASLAKELAYQCTAGINTLLIWV